MSDDPFEYQVGRLKKRNFKEKYYQIVLDLQQAKRLIDELKVGEVLKIEVHDYKLRGLIRDMYENTHEIKTKTDQGIDFHRQSTIITCRRCKKNMPYLKLKWFVICDDSSVAECLGCEDFINASDTENLLSKRHNLLIIKKYAGIIHRKCNKFISIDEVNWFYNEDGECYDTFCKHCLSSQDFLDSCKICLNNREDCELGFQYVK